MKNSFIKGLNLLVIAASLSTFIQLPANASWKSDSTGWWYTTFSKPYYYNKGWQKIDNKMYYFYSNGYMAHNTTIDGYPIDSNGVKQEKQSGECYWGADLMHMDFYSDSYKYKYSDPTFHNAQPNQYSTPTSVLDNLNNEYNNFLILTLNNVDEHTYIDFPLLGKYKKFTCKLGIPKDYQETLEDGLVRIYLDDKIAYEHTLSSGDMPTDISLDITGKQKIRFFFLLNEKKEHYTFSTADVGFFNGKFIK